MLCYSQKIYRKLKIWSDLSIIRSFASRHWLNQLRASQLPPKQIDRIFADKVMPSLISQQVFAVDDIVRSISRSKNSISIAAHLREAISRQPNTSAITDKLDGSLKLFLLGYCSTGSLVLKRISYIGTCTYVQDIITKEEKNLSKTVKIPDLKARLTRFRRCYAVFHRDDENCVHPLSFVHVALTDQLISRLEYLHRLLSF